MIVRDALRTARESFSELENPRLEAEWLVAHAAGTTPSKLVLVENQEIDSAWLAQAMRRRLEGEPLAYITGEKGFFKHTFIVRPGVLIPRPETELVVETALRLLGSDGADEICDIGSGSGCIGLSLLVEWPSALLTAVDSSEVAIETSRQNAERLGVRQRTSFKKENIEAISDEKFFNLIVANPPYIDELDSRVEKHVRQFEPREALFSGDSGYEDLFIWSAWAHKALRPGGWWVTEIGAGQETAVRSKLESLGYKDIGAERDLAGHVRVIYGRKRS